MKLLNLLTASVLDHDGRGNGMTRLLVVGRTVYGGRNALAYVFSCISRTYGSRVRLVAVEDNPTSIIRDGVDKGFKVLVLYSVPTPFFIELAKEIKQVLRIPGVTVAAGGPHASGAYWQLLRIGVKASIVADGEPAVLGLVEYVLGERDISEVPNIGFMDGDTPRITRIRLLEDIGLYDAHYEPLEMYPPIEIMRGCFYYCKFCQVPYMFKAKPRYRSLESILRSVRAWIRAGRRSIRFVAPIGPAYQSSRPGEPNLDALEELLSRVRSEGGKPYLGTFPSETRPEYAGPEVLKVLKRYVANRRLAIGLQVADDDLLRSMLRGHSVRDVEEAIDYAIKYGFKPVIDIIMGLPGEDEDAIKATCRFMELYAEKGVSFRLHTFMPLPGTPLALSGPAVVHDEYRRCIRRLLGKGVIEGDWREQEKLSRLFYCINAYDPKPSRYPKPLEEASRVCRDVWVKLGQLYSASEPLT